MGKTEKIKNNVIRRVAVNELTKQTWLKRGGAASSNVRVF